ncbi:TfoX/Sxy family protein [Noviherbaspirillum sp. ST9]|uniref:TfoX/Sxy family protein n=1 Tax=Noviherbaspirillum sp. ST9 TaxID=3401606 RepID=UPI003B58A164
MPDQRLSDLRNLGLKSEEMFAAIRIRTPAELAARGAIATFIALKQAGLPASLNMLWALEGALSDCDWREVARDDKPRLLTELEARGVKP